MNNLYGIPPSALVLLGMMTSALLLWLFVAVRQQLRLKQSGSGWARLEQTVAETQQTAESTQRPASDSRNKSNRRV